MVECKLCRKPAKIKFCSRSCANSYTNRLSPKRKMTRKCSVSGCDKPAERTKIRRCVDHKFGREGTERKTLGEYRNLLSVQGKHPSWVNAHIRVLNRSWNKHLTELPCASCGYSKHVELAHRKAIATYPDTATLGEVNHPDNVVQLCPNCHWEFDNGLDPLTGLEPAYSSYSVNARLEDG